MKGTTKRLLSSKTRKPQGGMPKNAVSKHAKARQQRQQAKKKDRDGD